MWQADSEIGKSIEQSAKDQVGGGDCGIKRISQQVMQIIARQPLRPDDIERMEKDRDSQCVNPLEDRKEQWVGQLFASHVRAKIDTAAAKLCDRSLDFRESSLG